MPLMMLRRFQQAGHRPIAVVGGATGMIGDPSGKSEERNLLSKERLEHNVAGMREQMRRFLDFDAERNAAVLVNNFDWIGPFSYLEFLRDVGKNFPVNVMLAKDSVKSRLGRDDASDQAGMSYTEFSYMLLQAYDFVHLYDEYGCELQVGGSDQWGNITAGIDLARRMRSVQLYGLTCPLLTKSRRHEDGQDRDGRGLALGRADQPVPVLPVLDQRRRRRRRASACGCSPSCRAKRSKRSTRPAQTTRPHATSQRRLAEELTRLVHGDAGLAAAQRATEIFFGAEIADLDDAQLGEIFADVPSETVSVGTLSNDGGLPIVDALVAAGLAKSKGEARRTIEQGGAYVNNRRVDGRRRTAHRRPTWPAKP